VKAEGTFRFQDLRGQSSFEKFRGGGVFAKCTAAVTSRKAVFFLIAKLFFNQANYGLCMLLQICPNRGLPVVPHKAVAEVSKIGNL
jgi:hypothetical protein